MLTAQELACGYIDRKVDNGVQLTLWQEHGMYHVRAHDFNEHVRLAWDVFETLAEARDAFKRHGEAIFV